MGYMIQYSPKQSHKYPSATHIVGRKIWSAVLTTVIVVALLGLAFTYRDFLIKWLLPGDAEATTMALEGLISDFQSGLPVDDVITTFCREIISSAAG